MSCVLVVADSVRADVFGCHGGEAQTPTIDRLAAEGVTFDRVITAAPWTVPSVASMMTGVYCHRLGLAKWDQPWPAAHPSLFDEAARAGCEVASFVFDPRFLFKNVPSAAVAGSSQEPARVFDWLRARRERGSRFFCFVHYFWTHVPYLARATDTRTWRTLTDRVLEGVRASPAARAGVRRLYLRAVEQLSELFVARLVDAIDPGKCWVALTADHGESWGERAPGAPPRDVFDLHGRTFFEEVLRVPLVLRPPGGVPPSGAARRVPVLARTVDLAPTLAELLGLELGPGWAAADGVSLAPWVRGEPGGPRPADAVSATTHDFLDAPALPAAPRELWSGLALTTDRHRLVWDLASDRRTAYDLAADPGETTDVAAAQAGELAPGWARLEAELARARVGELARADVDLLADQMRKLGYLE
jgi:arylsulfatase A-like enzyme